MIELIIQKEEAGRRLARFLEKLFPKAPRSLFFKALRSNKIKLNQKKPADLSIILCEGDELRLFFTEEQLTSFGYETAVKEPGGVQIPAVPVLYEDDQLLILDKPAGLLSQKSRPEDLSLTEIGQAMIQSSNPSEFRGYRPGVCNRLDRNTAGAVVMAKTLEASQAMAQMLRDRSLGKIYWALVEGVPEGWREQTQLINGWKKEPQVNKVTLKPWSLDLQGYQRIESHVKLLDTNGGCSLVEVRLLTGKSHQIRAQLAEAGFPILQDGKYNQNALRYAPMLVAKRLEFHQCPAPLSYMNGRVVEAAVPPELRRQMKQAGLKQ